MVRSFMLCISIFLCSLLCTTAALAQFDQIEKHQPPRRFLPMPSWP